MGNADAQKQATALQEQLSKAEADNAAEVQRLQQAESKLSGELKQARLDVQQVLIQCCTPALPHRAETRHLSFCVLDYLDACTVTTPAPAGIPVKWYYYICAWRACTGWS